MSHLTFERLKRLSFTHSAIYAGLLTAWLVPGLHREEFVLGLAHGIGWIIMCVLTLVALRARIIGMRLAVAVAVIGGIGPFVGSAEFIREERLRTRTLSAS
jgi:hypothetical protein